MDTHLIYFEVPLKVKVLDSVQFILEKFRDNLLKNNAYP